MAGDPSSLGTSSDPSEGKIHQKRPLEGRNGSHVCMDLMVGLVESVEPTRRVLSSEVLTLSVFCGRS